MSLTRISDILVSDNIDSASLNGVVKLTSSAPVLLSNSYFQRNIMSLGGALQCLGSCSVQDTYFEGNVAQGISAAGLIYSPLPSALEFSLLRVYFKDNYSAVGAALTITDINILPSKIVLNISSSIFERNRSDRLGSCIFITSSAALSDSSVIQHTQFVNNTAPQACLYNSFQRGVLLIDQCLFSYNQGFGASVLFSSNPASSPSVASRIILQSTTIERNVGFMCVSFNNQNFFSEGESRNLTFRDNTCTGFFLMWTYWTESGSVFLNNMQYGYSTCFVFLFFSKATMANSWLEGNTATLGANTISAITSSEVEITNSTFLSGKAGRRASLYADQRSVLIVRGCVFRRNVAREASAIYFFIAELSIPSYIYDSVFEDNFATDYGTIVVMGTNLTLTRCQFRNNKSSQYPGVSGYLSALLITDSTFAQQSSALGTFVAVPTSSTLVIQRCRFEKGQVTQSGTGIYARSSKVEVYDSVFSTLEADQGAAISTFSGSSLLISKCTFAHMISHSENGGIVKLWETTAVIKSSTFYNYTNGAIVGLDSSLSLQSSDFARGQSIRGAALLCTECQDVSITEVSCSFLKAVAASCIYLSVSRGVRQYTIESCDIHSNRGSSSGAVLVDSAGLLVRNSTFCDNSAEGIGGEGGALRLLCGQIYCSIQISDSLFANNSASHNGGAIAWNRFKPTFTNTRFKNNTAFYGPDVSSFPIALAFNSSYGALISGVPSGQIAPEIYIAIVDHYGQIVTTDSSSHADLVSAKQDSITITGEKQVVADHGLYRFSAYQVTCTPGTETQIAVVTTGIDLTKIETGITVSAELKINVSMRLCLPGENEFNSQCYPCPEGKYSLEPSQACRDCPVGAVCMGRTVMVPEAGYWRSRNNSAVFWKCPNIAACLGSNLTGEIEPIGVCAEGYYGNMCHGCVSGYFLSRRNTCSECPDPALGILKIIGVILLTLFFLLLVIKMSLVTARKLDSQPSIYLKMLVNYLQLMTVIAAFDLEWSGEVSSFLDAQDSVGNVSGHNLSLECFRQRKNDHQYSVFLQLIMASCIPIVILFVATNFWTLWALCYSRWSYLKYELVNSLCVAFFLVHPSIFKVAADFLNCKTIDSGELWMNSNLNVRCWDHFHSRYALGVALPSLILWGLFLPLVVLMTLIRRRKKLTQEYELRRFGFLYIGYQEPKFYWEFVILYRKVLLILIEVLLSTVSIPTQGLFAALILLIAFLLQIKRNPSKIPAINKLEQRTISAAAVTIYCGLIFLTSELDEGLHIALFTLILLANAYFLLYWLLQVGKVGCALLGRGTIDRSHMYRGNSVVPYIGVASQLRSPEESEVLASAGLVPRNSLVQSRDEEVSKR